MGNWALENWFELLSAVGVIGGLFFTAFSLRSETKTRRVANLLAISTNHRDVWQQMLEHPELARVLNPAADPIRHPITPQEEMLVNLAIQHIGSVYYAMKEELVVKLEGLRRDVSQFMALPIPAAVWEKLKLIQNDDFVAFVESCRNWK